MSDAFSLYGLRILRTRLSAVVEETPHDLLWDHAEVPSPLGKRTPLIFAAEEHGETSTVHRYGLPSEAWCEFRIAADGRRVLSRALPQVPEQDLFGLFAEPVMRSVLKARGLTSLHAAALERSGTSILLLGDKGAGKSTLCAMLLRDGWSLLTDDLARVLNINGRWAVTPGFRQLKLHPDAARALGFNSSLAQLRWSSNQAPNDPHLNKSVFTFPGGTEAAPVRAIYVVGPRGLAGDSVQVEGASPVTALRSLVTHITEDPAAPDAPPSRLCVQDCADIVRTTPVRIISVPQGVRPGIDLSAFCK